MSKYISFSASGPVANTPHGTIIFGPIDPSGFIGSGNGSINLGASTPSSFVPSLPSVILNKSTPFSLTTSANGGINLGANGGINLGASTPSSFTPSLPSVIFSPDFVLHITGNGGVTGPIGTSLIEPLLHQHSSHLTDSEKAMLKDKPINVLKPLIITGNLVKLATVLTEHGPEGELLFNVNSLVDQEQRLIDIVCTDAPKEKQLPIITLLRKKGSVEPKIAIGNGFKKLVISEDKAPDSNIENCKNAEWMLTLIDQNYNLTEEDLTELISNFKKSKNFTQYKAAWKDEGIDDVSKVIDKLTSLRKVNDRLSKGWDFKKVLGTLIHITNDNDELQSKLIYTLGTIEMCSLSKLMHLLSVGQDMFLATSSEKDYTKTTLADFHGTIGLVCNNIYEHFNEKAGLAVSKWLNDIAYQKNNPPEKWCSYTQIINGFFNEALMQCGFVDESSYHFINGLQESIIKPLIATIGVAATVTPEQTMQYKLWFDLVRDGIIQSAEALFTKILNEEGSFDKNLSLLDQSHNNPNLAFGGLECMTKFTIEKFYKLISEKYSLDEGKKFLNKLLENCIFNDEVTQYIEFKLNQDDFIETNNGINAQENVNIGVEFGDQEDNVELQGNSSNDY